MENEQRQEIRATRRIDDARVATRGWGGNISMPLDAAAEFVLGEVYWLEEKQPYFLRPEFRRRAKVVSICQARDYRTIGFVSVPDPPQWSLETDPESRQLRGIVL